MAALPLGTPRAEAAGWGFFAAGLNRCDMVTARRAAQDPQGRQFAPLAKRRFDQ
jgi:hypothetical protein